MRILIASLAGLVTLGFAEPVLALDGNCLWGYIPTAQRDAYFSAYERGGMDGVVDLIGLDNHRLTQAGLACWGGPIDSVADARKGGAIAAKLFLGVALERASAQYLASKGVPRAALDRAWAQLGPSRRGGIRENIFWLIERGDPTLDDTSSAMIEAAKAAGWRSGKTEVRPYIDYFTGRALREEYEAQRDF